MHGRTSEWMVEGCQKVKGGSMVTSESIRAKQLRLLTDKRSDLTAKRYCQRA